MSLFMQVADPKLPSGMCIFSSRATFFHICVTLWISTIKIFSFGTVSPND